VWRVSWSLTGNILAVSDGNNLVTLWKEAVDGNWSKVSISSRLDRVLMLQFTFSHLGAGMLSRQGCKRLFTLPLPQCSVGLW